MQLGEKGILITIYINRKETKTKSGKSREIKNTA